MVGAETPDAVYVPAPERKDWQESDDPRHYKRRGQWPYTRSLFRARTVAVVLAPAITIWLQRDTLPPAEAQNVIVVTHFRPTIAAAVPKAIEVGRRRLAREHEILQTRRARIRAELAGLEALRPQQIIDGRTFHLGPGASMVLQDVSGSSTVGGAAIAATTTVSAGWRHMAQGTASIPTLAALTAASVDAGDDEAWAPPDEIKPVVRSAAQRCAAQPRLQRVVVHAAVLRSGDFHPSLRPVLRVLSELHLRFMLDAARVYLHAGGRIAAMDQNKALIMPTHGSRVAARNMGPSARTRLFARDPRSVARSFSSCHEAKSNGFGEWLCKRGFCKDTDLQKPAFQQLKKIMFPVRSAASAFFSFDVLVSTDEHGMGQLFVVPVGYQCMWAGMQVEACAHLRTLGLITTSVGRLGTQLFGARFKTAMLGLWQQKSQWEADGTNPPKWDPTGPAVDGLYDAFYRTCIPELVMLARPEGSLVVCL